MKVLRMVVVVVALVASGALVAGRIADSRAIAKQKRVIQAQETEKREVRQERARHDREVRELGGAMKALDDTTRAAQMGIAIKKSEVIAKKLFILDNRETRANARVRSATEAIEAIRAHGRKRSWWLGVGFIVFAACYAGLRRFSK